MVSILIATEVQIIPQPVQWDATWLGSVGN
jgi:hypothetical protein